jgi:SAM-dependent methyltransferase
MRTLDIMFLLEGRNLLRPVNRSAPNEAYNHVTRAIEWPSGDGTTRVEDDCPNCGDAGSKPIILRAVWPGRKGQDGWAALVGCSNCGCGFFSPAEAADYSANPVGGEGAMAFYLQQGAGLWSITSNLIDLNRAAGTRLLEVGCGFGFGLDFAKRVLGWEVLGLDPSPFAAHGRAALGLPIEPRYLSAEDATLVGRFDVVMASEVIEHLASPLAFARALRTALCDGGTLILTTPDVEAVAPSAPPGLLVPLLSIGYHLVLQSERSLAKLLSDAGFEEIEVRRAGGASLMARCRCGTATDDPTLTAPFPRDDRGLYRRYLCDAAAAAEPDSDLWFGLTARSFREAVNAADSLVAGPLWDDFSDACRRRFGFAPEAAAEVSYDVAGEALDVLARREPLCLGPMLLHRAFHRLLTGAPRTSVEIQFRCAAEACGRLRRSLQRIGTDDGDAEDIAWVAGAEELLCAAERGATKVPERFAALGRAPSDAVTRLNEPSRRTDEYRRRLFVSLVNSARLDDADHLADVVTQVEARMVLPDVILTDGELDVLFCGAMRELQRPKAAAHALKLLRQLLVACADVADRPGSATTLVTPARNAEILALDLLGRKEEANTLRRTVVLTGKRH